MSGTKKRRYAIFRFDLHASAEFAKRLLEQANVSGALIGTVRTWTALPSHEQYETKDLDLVVRQEDTVWIEKALRDTHVPFGYCEIGGICVELPAEGIKVDFVDRRVELAPLFREALAAAEAEGESTEIGEVELLSTPIEYVIAMKLAVARVKDDLVLDALLRVADFNYERAREIVLRLLGPASAYRLDAMAHRAGRR